VTGTVSNGFADRRREGKVERITKPMAAEIPVLIVSFRNPSDVNACLGALSRLAEEPSIGVFICENGGADAFDDLVAVLTGPEGTCDSDTLPPMLTGPRFVRSMRLQLRTVDLSRVVCVHVGEAGENLGYAGGVNAYLEPLLAITEWPGVWVLNPDTEPEPDALNELVRCAVKYRREMVGSRQRQRHNPDIILGRGLAWRKWRAATRLVDLGAPSIGSLTPDQIEGRLDSPSGASMYVTRRCIQRIGLMDERYFLYYEDLDWGMRAKRLGQIACADLSVVVHGGGTTIGGGLSRRNNSPLSVYLEFRNRLLFTQVYFPKWLAWTFFMEMVEIMEYVRLGSFRNMSAALRGSAAGLMGREGRPDDLLRLHKSPMRKPQSQV
jgi:N-acetylglucosaminyl-diphospho-decaprenol L-rhamnosyltransferase